MNSFANTMFAMLFGGIRSLIQRVWTTAAEGRLGGFFTWLGDHWLWVALFLCIACTAADFLVWLIRWRPYLVWKTWARKVRRLFRGERKQQRMFERGYNDALVPMNMPAAQDQGWPEEQWEEPPQETPPQAAPAYPEEYAPQAPYQTPAEPAYAPAPQPEPVQYEAPQYEAPAAPRGRKFTPPAYEAPPMEMRERPVSVYGAESSYTPRQRRSDRHEKKRGEWQKRLAAITRDDVGMIDGLPPAIDRQDAFHEPVYPNPPTVTQAAPVRASQRQQGGGA